MDSIEKFIYTGRSKNDLIRYIPGITKPAYQGQLEETLTKKTYADDTYKRHRVAEFNVQLTDNQYMNFRNMHLVFPMKIKKITNNATNLDATLMTVNNVFVHWIKEIDIKRYGDEIPILPLINAVDIYKYSDAMLKFEEDDTLKTYQHHLLYSKKNVKLPTGKDRRSHYTTNDAHAGKRTDDNLDDRIADQLQTEFYYRISLRFLCGLGLVNQPVKFNSKWLLTFETDYQRLFESKANQANDALPDSVDAKIIFTSTRYILYEQFKLEDNCGIISKV